MPTLSEVFRNIHRLRRHVRELQIEIERAPVQLKARQNHSTKQAAALQAARDRLKKKQVEVRDQENNLKTEHETLTKYTRQLDEVGDPKAYEALQHEITASKTKCEQLEESILNGLTDVDTMTAQIPEAEAAAKKAAAELSSFDSDQKVKLERITAEMKTAQEELKKVEADIPADVKPEYVRRVASYGADALAAVEEGCCSHCRTAASQQQQLNLQRDHFVTCTSCYRALYIPVE